MSDEVRRRVTVDNAMVEAFAAATGDYSSIHMDAEFARKSRYRRQVVHGMLPVAALLLTLPKSERDVTLRLGRLSCRFLQPVFFDEGLELVHSRKSEPNGGATENIEFKILKDGSVVTDGTAAFVVATHAAKRTGADARALSSVRSNKTH